MPLRVSVRERLRSAWRDPEWRIRAIALIGGKVIGLSMLGAAMYVFLPPVVHAQSGGPSPEMNALNTMWVLLAAFLVFCMQVGFVMLEAGFARSRESIKRVSLSADAGTATRKASERVIGSLLGV